MGKKAVDYLIRVHWLDGSTELLLAHVEVQSQYDVALEERVYVYCTYIDMRYSEPVIRLVILADDRPGWKPYAYERNLLDRKLYFEFHVCKLLELSQDQQALQRKGPAVIVVLAHVLALQTHKDMQL